MRISDVGAGIPDESIGHIPKHSFHLFVLSRFYIACPGMATR